jgi:nitroreductase family protein
MTSVMSSQLTTALRRAAVRATRAPSVHNTQPWRLVLDGDCLEIHVDPSRQLRVLDPRGSRARMSCGSALFNARVALAASGYRVTVERFPDPARPYLLARIVVDEAAGPGEAALTQLEPMIDLRHMNRRRFSDEVVPGAVLDTLVDAANIEGGEVVAIVRPGDQLAADRLSRLADQIQSADPAGQAELQAWTSDDPGRWDAVVPAVHGRAPTFRPGQDARPDRGRPSTAQCLLVLGTVGDDPVSWVRAGEALERMLLELTRLGYVASPMTSVIEVEATNEQLRRELRLPMHPRMLLRVGRAPATPPTRRRRLVDVLSEAG